MALFFGEEYKIKSLKKGGCIFRSAKVHKKPKNIKNFEGSLSFCQRCILSNVAATPLPSVFCRAIRRSLLSPVVVLKTYLYSYILILQQLCVEASLLQKLMERNAGLWQIWMPITYGFYSCQGASNTLCLACEKLAIVSS